MGLSLESVTPISNNTGLRVRFNGFPKRSNAFEANDALNSTNWNLTGPGFVGISYIATTGADPRAVDIILSSRLPAGSWLLRVVNVQTSSLEDLESPTDITFNVSDIVNGTQINPGSSNDNCEDILRKYLNPTLRGTGWDALISGIAAGDSPNFENTKLSLDQLYIASANGNYLDRITANDGIVRPKNVGMSDDIYRELATKIKNNKVTNEALLEVLAVYYGEDAVRAHATTDGFEPYALVDGDDLNITIDGVYKAKVVFTTSDFSSISSAKATEVAAAITRAFIIQNIKAFAKAFVDPVDGETKVKIYTASLGLKGSVQIRGSGGGKAQNVLKFEDSLNTPGAFGSVYTGTVTSASDLDPVSLGTPCALTWYQATPLRSPKELNGHGVKLNDNRVLVGLGKNFQDSDAHPDYNNQFELINTNGTRTNIPDFPVSLDSDAQIDSDMVLLGNGNVLAVYTISSVPKTATLNSGSLTWTARPDAPYSIVRAVGLTMADGNAIYVGADGAGDKTIIYNQNTNTWSTVAAPNHPRIEAQGILLDSGKIFVCGGDGQNTAEVYDPNTNTWTNCTNTFSEIKKWHSVCKLGNGAVLITGGYDGTFNNADKAYVYNPNFNVLAPKSAMPKKLILHRLLNLQNNYAVAVGGTSVSDISKKVYYYNPNTDTWTDSGTDLAIGRAGFNCFEIGSCKIMAAGGEINQFQPDDLVGITATQTTPSVEISNLGGTTYYAPPVSFLWAQTDTLSQARTNLTGVTLLDGSFMVIGGQDKPDEVGATAWYNNVDLISSDGLTVTATDPIPWAAAHVQAVMLPNGSIFAAGGWTSQTAGSSTTAVYDTNVGVWTTTDPLPVALRDHRMAVVDSPGNPHHGHVILIGGRKNDGTAWDKYIFYNPDNDSWIDQGDLSTGVFGGAIMALSGGAVSYYCGWTDAGASTIRLVYLPDVDSVSEYATPLNFPGSFRPEIIRTADGKYMISGGFDDLTDFGGSPGNINSNRIFMDLGGENINQYGRFAGYSNEGKADHKLVLLPYSDYYHVGAISGIVFGSGLFVLDCYDTILFDLPASNPISKDAPSDGLGGPERGFVAFTTSDNKILVVGGYDQSDSFTALNSVWKSVN